MVKDHVRRVKLMTVENPVNVFMQRFMCVTLVVTMLLLLCPLSWAQDQPEPTRLVLDVYADPKVNLSDDGSPSPIRVRIFELKDSSVFSRADYFTLDANASLALAGDLLAGDEFILRPGEHRRIERKSNPQSTAIGVLAGYRDLAHTVWRAVYRLPAPRESSWYTFFIPLKKADLDVQLQTQGIVVVNR